MPEGPEVETIVRGLQQVVGSTIGNITFHDPKDAGLVKNSDSAAFCGNALSCDIEVVQRFGKWILFILKSPNPEEPRSALLSHLAMFGHWRLYPTELAPSVPHARLTFTLGTQKGPQQLTYSDMRSWGRLYSFKPVQQAYDFLRGRVGTDFTLLQVEEFRAMLRRDVRPIGEMLLDQSLVAGVGNIYRSEILWASGIAPDRPCVDLEEDEAVRVWGNLRSIMAQAIQMRGSSIKDYRDTNGQRGTFHNFLKAYGKTGEPCQSCSSPILVTKEIDGRAVFYCPICQR